MSWFGFSQLRLRYVIGARSSHQFKCMRQIQSRKLACGWAQARAEKPVLNVPKLAQVRRIGPTVIDVHRGHYVAIVAVIAAEATS